VVALLLRDRDLWNQKSSWDMADMKETADRNGRYELVRTLASIESECLRFSRSTNVSKIPDAIGRLGLRKLLTE
jgi:hypothetical protein